MTSDRADRDAPQPLGGPDRGRRPPAGGPRPGRPRLRRRRDARPSRAARCRRPASPPARAGGPARRCSAPSTCSPTTTCGGCAPAASPRRTCCAPAPATSRTLPTPSSARSPTTRWSACSPSRSSTAWPWCPSVAAPRSSAAWSPGARASPAWSRLDLVRMDRLLALDRVSMTATLQPGLRGPEAEALLAAEGLMLGHYPQSFEHATIGGFAATRSSGQASAGYGRFDALVVGLRAATPRGELRLGGAPASAAGPDLRQLLLGSEGAFGVLTEVTVRVRRAARAEGLRGLAVAVVRGRRRRHAHPGPVRAAAHGDPALRRGRDRDQPGPPRRHRRPAARAAAA